MSEEKSTMRQGLICTPSFAFVCTPSLSPKTTIWLEPTIQMKTSAQSAANIKKHNLDEL